MNHDRTYWRSVDDRRLIEAARDSGNELAIALGERLADYVDAYGSLERLEEMLDHLRGDYETMTVKTRAVSLACPESATENDA